MRKPTICICENKDADQIRSNHEADQRLRFRYIDSTIPLLPKYEIISPSSHLVWLYSLDCFGPGRKPEDRFSHNEAQKVINYMDNVQLGLNFLRLVK